MVLFDRPAGRDGAAAVREVADAGSATGTARLRTRLRDSGLGAVRGLSSAAGATAVRDALLVSSGDGALTWFDLGCTPAATLPHTARAHLPGPPRVLMLTPADRGTAVSARFDLIDARAVTADLLGAGADVVHALTRPGGMQIDASDGCAHPCAVLTSVGRRRMMIRLRLDGAARFSRPVGRRLPALVGALERHRVPVALDPGQALVIDNHRWLVACRPGSPPVLRSAGDLAGREPLPPGYLVAAALRPAAPRPSPDSGGLPPWVPPDGPRQVEIGPHWEAVFLPGPVAGPVAATLVRRGLAGPILAPAGVPPAGAYVLVPEGTAATWSVPGTRALSGGWLLVPPRDTCVGPGVHWLRAPRPAGPLTRGEDLREAVEFVRPRPEVRKPRTAGTRP